MRRFTKIFAFFLTFVIAFSFTACKKKGDDKGSDKGNDNVQEEFEKMQEVLQKEGFEVVDDFDPAAAEMKAQLEAENADGPAIEFHMLKDSKAMTSGAEPAANALVAEFRKADDIINFCKNSDIVRRYAGDIADSDDARAIYDRLKEGGYISGKCLIIPIPVQEEELTAEMLVSEIKGITDTMDIDAAEKERLNKISDAFAAAFGDVRVKHFREDFGKKSDEKAMDAFTEIAKAFADEKYAGVIDNMKHLMARFSGMQPAPAPEEEMLGDVIKKAFDNCRIIIEELDSHETAVLVSKIVDELSVLFASVRTGDHFAEDMAGMEIHRILDTYAEIAAHIFGRDDMFTDYVKAVVNIENKAVTGTLGNPGLSDVSVGELIRDAAALLEELSDEEDGEDEEDEVLNIFTEDLAKFYDDVHLSRMEEDLQAKDIHDVADVLPGIAGELFGQDHGMTMIVRGLAEEVKKVLSGTVGAPVLAEGITIGTLTEDLRGIINNLPEEFLTPAEQKIAGVIFDEVSGLMAGIQVGEGLAADLADLSCEKVLGAIEAIVEAAIDDETRNAEIQAGFERLCELFTGTIGQPVSGDTAISDIIIGFKDLLDILIPDEEIKAATDPVADGLAKLFAGVDAAHPEDVLDAKVYDAADILEEMLKNFAPAEYEALIHQGVAIIKALVTPDTTFNNGEVNSELTIGELLRMVKGMLEVPEIPEELKTVLDTVLEELAKILKDTKLYEQLDAGIDLNIHETINSLTDILKVLAPDEFDEAINKLAEFLKAFYLPAATSKMPLPDPLLTFGDAIDKFAEVLTSMTSYVDSSLAEIINGVTGALADLLRRVHIIKPDEIEDVRMDDAIDTAVKISKILYNDDQHYDQDIKPLVDALDAVVGGTIGEPCLDVKGEQLLNHLLAAIGELQEGEETKAKIEKFMKRLMREYDIDYGHSEDYRLMSIVKKMH